MSDRLATAQWEDPALIAQRYPFTDGTFWLGRTNDWKAIGYRDDRHICLVSGTRGGKGTSLIINNLCFWPGSAVVVDPKGENATVTAARRGRGDDYCTGMGQAVHVLDPFNTTHVEDHYRSRFNPLDALHPNREETIDEASRLANAIVVVKEDAHEPIWDESARTMLKGLILHVLTARQFDGERDLITVRKLILRGEWRLAEAMRETGNEKKATESPYLLLWRSMELNPAFDGIIAGIGSEFRAMMQSSPKTFLSIFRSLSQHTEFLDSPGMRRVLAKSDFKLSDLKTDPRGMTLYLSLPQRYMDTHYRWLRMMVALTTTEMEITRGRPATGHPVLMVLDEFAGLKRMSAIETAAAQIAGFGVKLFFVLQSLEQLKATYRDDWETFLSNAGVKVFFSINDNFTREYVSKQIGETEVIIELQSSNESTAENESFAEGHSHSITKTKSTTRGKTVSDTVGTSIGHSVGESTAVNTGRSVGTNEARSVGENDSRSESTNQSRSLTESFGQNQSTSRSRGGSSGSSTSYGPGGLTTSFSSGGNSSFSESEGSSHSTSDGVSYGTGHAISIGTTRGFTQGTSSNVSIGVTEGRNRSDTTTESRSRTSGQSISNTEGISTTTGKTHTRTTGVTSTKGAGRNQSVHRRPLIYPHEVGRDFARIDDRNHPFYPGLALVIVTGAAAHPLMVRRVHYFEDPQFIGCFSPHPDHEFMAAAPNIVGGIRPLIETLEAAMKNGGRLTIAQWFIETGKPAFPGQLAATIERVPPDDRTVHIPVPCLGKVAELASTNRLPSGEYAIPDGALFAVKTYAQGIDIDPFRELREACQALKKPPATEQPKSEQEPAKAGVPGWLRRTWALPEVRLALLAGAIMLTLPLPFIAFLLALPLFIAWSLAEYGRRGWWRMLVRWALFWSISAAGFIAVRFTTLDPYPAGVFLVPVAVLVTIFFSERAAVGTANTRPARIALKVGSTFKGWFRRMRGTRRA
jgi:type IV secretory pathway TraG/TraD family ATPase VirD4